MIFDWIIPLICILAIPLALSVIQREDRIDMNIFLCSLVMTLIYAIYIGILPNLVVVIPVIIIIIMLFGGRNNE